jgi:hypothetical protein
MIVYVAALLVIAVVSTAVLCGVVTARHALMPAHEYYLPPPWAFYFSVGFMLGLFGGGLVLDVWMRATLGPRRLRVYGLLCGVNPTAFRVFYAVPVGVVLVATGLGSDWYTRFDADHLVLNRFWSLGETPVPYAEVTHVVVTTHFDTWTGRRVARPQVYLVFRGGGLWCYEDQAFEDGYPCPQELIDLMLRKTGLPLTRATVIDDVIPPG